MSVVFSWYWSTESHSDWPNFWSIDMCSITILILKLTWILNLHFILCPRSVLAKEGVSLQILHPWIPTECRSFRWLRIHHNQCRLETSLHFYSLSLYRGLGGCAAGVGWADTNTNITVCSGRGSTANSSHRAPSCATLSAGDPEFIMASCPGTRRTAATEIEVH